MNRLSPVRSALSTLVLGAAALAAFAGPAVHEAGSRTPGAAPGAATPVTTRLVADEPLTDSDRDLLVKVRLAGLWERPAGRMAAEKGTRARVRQIGAMIAAQHVQLDKLDVEAAAEVGVPLPDAPNEDQQKWLGEMAAAQGPDFDEIFVNRLRAAHGKVFPVIAQVRTGTQNSVVRGLAQQANNFVLQHLTMLESTGLVDYPALQPAAQSQPQSQPQPQPQGQGQGQGQPQAAPIASTSTADPGTGAGSTGWVVGFVVLAIAIGAYSALRQVGSPRTGRSRAAAGPRASSWAPSRARLPGDDRRYRASDPRPDPTSDRASDHAYDPATGPFSRPATGPVADPWYDSRDRPRY